MTSQEDELTGRGTHRKTNSQEDELGTAQPQLVLIYSYSRMYCQNPIQLQVNLISGCG